MSALKLRSPDCEQSILLGPVTVTARKTGWKSATWRERGPPNVSTCFRCPSRIWPPFGCLLQRRRPG